MSTEQEVEELAAINAVTDKIISCAIEVHRQLGPGLLEQTYETAIAVVVELKSVERYDPVFMAQVLTYLRCTGLRVGLLINFNGRVLRAGIRRFIL